MKIKITAKELNGKKDFLYDIKKPYEYRRSGHSLHLEVDGVVYYAYNLDEKEQLPITHIYFITKVKKHILKNELHDLIKKRYLQQDDIKFIEINWNICAGEQFDKCFCVDISKAYWKSAYKLGYVDEKLYEEGLNIDKRVRLACLGTFAKKVYRYQFDGEEEVFKKDIEPSHPWVFFNPANMVYEAMDRCRKELGDSFMFYWTDGVYVKDRDAAKRCAKILEELDYESTIQPIRRIKRTTTHFIVNEKKVYGKGKQYCIHTRTTAEY